MTSFTVLPRYIFGVVLLIGLISQSWFWQHANLTDRHMWERHIADVYQLNAAMFDPGVYGHPGALIVVVGTIAHLLLGASFENALIGSMTVIISVATAAATTLAYVLRRQSLWWLTVPSVLYGNHLFLSITPPTAVVAPLLVVVFLVSWLIYDRAPAGRGWLVAWAVAVGLSAAVRTDITGVTALPLLLVLTTRVGWRRSLLLAFGALLIFSMTNPFMWFMPIRHSLDLIGVALWHYTAFGAVPLPLSGATFSLISPFSFISVALGLVFLVGRSLPSPIPRFFLGAWLSICILVTLILLHSRFQATRYFFPYAFIWETLLPLFILALLEYRGRRPIYIVAVIFFILFPLSLSLHCSCRLDWCFTLFPCT